MARRYQAVLFDLLTGLLDSWTLWNSVAGSESAGRRWRAAYLGLTYGCGSYEPYEVLVARAARQSGLPEQLAETLALRQGYGVVCDENGEPLNDVIVKHAHQEHGILSHRSGDPARMPQLPVGALVRILPNHACATAGQFREYNVVRGDARIEARWQRLAD
jgi:D-serine deaminase-like pyridoxal phosphate-dependent protein